MSARFPFPAAEPMSPSELRLFALSVLLAVARSTPRLQLPRTAGIHPREALFTEEDLQAAFLLGYEKGVER